MGNEFQFSTEEREFLKRLGITALVLFGSRAQGIGKETSDYDIGVLLDRNERLSDTARRNEIYDALYDVVSDRIQKLANIDIVFLAEAPAELKAHVMKFGKVICASNPSSFADFKEKTMLEYSDFAPLRAEFHRAILERIT